MTTTQPNILLVMADQLVPMLTGAYGHPVVRTPAMEALVARGVRFDAAYTPAPLCAPARACLMTGTYTSTNRVYDNSAPLASDVPTIAHHLTNAGYDCVLSGKMHFVGPDQLHGFRTRFNADIYPADFRWLRKRAPWSLSRDPADFSGAGHGRHVDAYVGSDVQVGRWHHHLAYDEQTHHHAIQYLRAHAAEETGQPFLLTVSYHHPHDPFWPPVEFWERYRNADVDLPDVSPGDFAMDRWLDAGHGVGRTEELRDPASLRQIRRAYYAQVSYVDQKIGELLATLDETGLDDDTVVIVTSDHGDMLGERGMVQKRAFYENSSRVPMILRLPADQHAGTVVTEPVNLVDVLPTLADLVGIPAAELHGCDGASMLPLLQHSGEPRTTFAEEHVEDVAAPCFMVRRGTHKLVYVHGHGVQLFDLAADPDERKNLADDPDSRPIVVELRAAILDRFDPDAVERDVRRSLAARLTILEAMERTQTQWHHVARQPAGWPDAVRQYLP